MHVLGWVGGDSVPHRGTTRVLLRTSARFHTAFDYNTNELSARRRWAGRRVEGQVGIRGCREGKRRTAGASIVLATPVVGCRGAEGVKRRNANVTKLGIIRSLSKRRSRKVCV